MVAVVDKDLAKVLGRCLSYNVSSTGTQKGVQRVRGKAAVTGTEQQQGSNVETSE